MDDSEYQQALRREAAWLDEQLAQYAVQQQAGAATNLASTDRFESADMASEQRGGIGGLRFENAPPGATDFGDTEFSAAQPNVRHSTDFGIAQPPQTPMWRKKLTRLFGSPYFSSALLFLLLVTAGLGLWQAIQSKSYKRQADQAAENVQKWGDAQIELDNRLCSAGYPAVANSLKDKVAAKAALSNSEKALLAFGSYRTETPNITGTEYRVDAVPACPDPYEAAGEGQSAQSGANAATDQAADPQ